MNQGPSSERACLKTVTRSSSLSAVAVLGMEQLAGDLFEVGAVGSVAGLVAGLAPFFVVPDDNDEVCWHFAADGGDCAEVHEEGAVAVEGDDFVGGG